MASSLGGVDGCLVFAITIELLLPELGAAIPPAPNNMLNSHPLLVRQPDAHPIGGSLTRSRGGLSLRNRGAYRYNPGTQTLVHYIDNSGRTSRLGHSPNNLLHK